jgi:hypothetical protein
MTSIYQVNPSAAAVREETRGQGKKWTGTQVFDCLLKNQTTVLGFLEVPCSRSPYVFFQH